MSGRAATKDLVLDAAEALFSAKGVDGVSLRTLTKEAGVNLAAVHYHFGSKEEVVKAVFARRIRPMNRERLAMLDALEGSGRPEVEEIVTALVAPALRLAGDSPDRQRFMRLCARLYSEPAEYLQQLYVDEFSQVIDRFERVFRSALPSLSRAEVRRRMHFVVGLLVHTMLNSAPVRRWTSGACDPADAESTLAAIVSFAAAGMRAPVPDPPDGVRAAVT
ncbi:MAG: TetR/AcrR family transcriptional regulator [Bryobacterales bacterium]|nr:TetR/AcrR family transcriptional regulator [Bryobacterales bacterium]